MHPPRKVGATQDKGQSEDYRNGDGARDESAMPDLRTCAWFGARIELLKQSLNSQL